MCHWVYVVAFTSNFESTCHCRHILATHTGKKTSTGNDVKNGEATTGNGRSDRPWQMECSQEFIRFAGLEEALHTVVWIDVMERDPLCAYRNRWQGVWYQFVSLSWWWSVRMLNDGTYNILILPTFRREPMFIHTCAVQCSWFLFTSVWVRQCHIRFLHDQQGLSW